MSLEDLRDYVFVHAFGPLHIVVEDLNVDDENLRACMRLPECTGVHMTVAEYLLTLDEDERYDLLSSL